MDCFLVVQLASLSIQQRFCCVQIRLHVCQRRQLTLQYLQLTKSLKPPCFVLQLTKLRGAADTSLTAYVNGDPN